MIDLTILMDTTLGRPAAMLEAAANNGVGVVAGCLFPRLGGRVAHVAVNPEDVETVRRVVAEHGGTIADERECVVVPNDYPGGAPAVSRAVAVAGIVGQRRLLRWTRRGRPGHFRFGRHPIGPRSRPESCPARLAGVGRRVTAHNGGVRMAGRIERRTIRTPW